MRRRALGFGFGAGGAAIPPAAGSAGGAAIAAARGGEAILALLLPLPLPDMMASRQHKELTRELCQDRLENTAAVHTLCRTLYKHLDRYKYSIPI